MKLLLILFITTLCLGCAPWAHSRYIDTQSGSLMGLIHLSIGDHFFTHHHLSFGLGYVPKLEKHAEMTLASFAYRYQQPFHFKLKNHFLISPLNFGISILVGSHRELFIELPSQYPDDDYYEPSAFRLIFNYQSILHVSHKTELYLNFSILDVGLIGYVREPNFYRDNYRFLGLDGITTWGLGLRHKF